MNNTDEAMTVTERILQRIPGHDCIYDVCRLTPPCQTKAPGSRWATDGRNHGIGGERWLYVVRADNGQHAIAFVVHTDLFPPTVPADHAQRCGLPPEAPGRRRTIDRVVGHIAVPVGAPCDLVVGGHCEAVDVVGYFAAEALWKEHAEPAQAEQPESFWRALEGLLDRLITESTVLPAPKADHAVASACNGQRCRKCERYPLVAATHAVIEAVGAVVGPHTFLCCEHFREVFGVEICP